jgi:hypothetical protein
LSNFDWTIPSYCNWRHSSGQGLSHDHEVVFVFQHNFTKVVDPMKLTKLQDNLILTICNLKTIFLPSFFDLMPHLLIHIVHEMKYLGPVFLHQIYPFKRFMTVLKEYVHNQSRSEGCMVQGWVTKEVIEFVVDYMDLQAIG